MLSVTPSSLMKPRFTKSAGSAVVMSVGTVAVLGAL